MNYGAYRRLRNQEFQNNIISDPLLMNHIDSNKRNFITERNYPDFRAYKDESTKIFNSIYFNDENMLQLFTYYCYQQINYDIISNINTSLSANNEIIKYKEEILLIFKGGNVTKLYTDNIYNILQPQNIPNHSNQGSASDTDFSFFIINDDEKKFNLIYNYVSQLLYQSLITIRDHFENIFMGRFIPLDEDFINFDPNLYILNNYIFFESINSYENLILRKLNNCSEGNTLDINILFDLINNYFMDNQRIKVYSDIHIGTKFIKILTSIQYYLNYGVNTIANNIRQDIIHNIQLFYDNIDNTINIQRNIIQTNLNILVNRLQNFYTDINKNLLINNLSQSLNDPNGQFLNKSYYQYYETKILTEYRINNNDNHLEYSPKNDLIIRDVQNIIFTSIFQNNRQNNHYISINSTIFCIYDNYNLMFDLYRIKLNIRLNNIYNITNGVYINLSIPTEFLDISIPKYNDTTLMNIRKKFKNNNNPNYNYRIFFSKLSFNNNQYNNILMYNLSYLIKDLNVMLFGQNFMPWINNKYEKRLRRFIFLSIILFCKKDSYLNPGVINHQDKIVIIKLNKIKTHLDDIYKNLCNYYFNKHGLQQANIRNYLNNRNIQLGANIDMLKNEINNNIEYFIDSNLLLDQNIIKNFYDTIQTTFFKINYKDTVEFNNNKNLIVKEIFGDEFDELLNFIFKLINFEINDNTNEIFEKYIKLKFNSFKYIFLNNDENNYINDVLRIDILKFLKLFNEIFEANLDMFSDYNYINISMNNIQAGGDNYIKNSLKIKNNTEKFLKIKKNENNKLLNNSTNAKTNTKTNKNKYMIKINKNSVSFGSSVITDFEDDTKIDLNKSNNNLTKESSVYVKKGTILNILDEDTLDYILENKKNKNSNKYKYFFKNTNTNTNTNKNLN
jgi:hypothetical protein